MFWSPHGGLPMFWSPQICCVERVESVSRSLRRVRALPSGGPTGNGHAHCHQHRTETIWPLQAESVRVTEWVVEIRVQVCRSLRWCLGREWMDAYEHTQKHTHTRTHACTEHAPKPHLTHACKRTHTHPNAQHARANTRTCTHKNTHKNTRTHTYTTPPTHERTHDRTYTHPHMHANICARTHTHTQLMVSMYRLQSVETVLQTTTPFTHAKVALWQATIVENALKRLAAQNKPFKYVGQSLSTHSHSHSLTHTQNTLTNITRSSSAFRAWGAAARCTAPKLPRVRVGPVAEYVCIQMDLHMCLHTQRV